ncbi:MAG: rhomboid family intramembrane serine protease [Candidatus Aenigmatarchaeota archaeon]|nr:rhomboid family intramembrane serine protease [Candidatus Aenigmarchaeota archaeon]
MLEKRDKRILDDKEFRWVAIKISIIMILIYILSLRFPNFFFSNFLLSASSVFKKPWTLITYAFLHSQESIAHIFYNVFALAMFGSILEKIIGYKRFLFVFFSSSLFASLIGIHFYNNLIGASGGIMGIIGCLTIIKPKMIIVGFGAPIPLILASLFWVFGDFLGVFYPDDVAHISHLSGILFGFLIGGYIRLIENEKKEQGKKPKEKRISEEEFRNWEEKWMKR